MQAPANSPGRRSSRAVRALAAASAVLSVCLFVLCLVFLLVQALGTGPSVSGPSLFALLGTSLLSSLVGALLALPLAIGAGAYLAGSPDSRTIRALGSIVDVASGVPTVVLGVCFSILVLPLVSGSASLSLALIAISLGNAIYVLPIMTQLCRSRAQQVPRLQNIAVLALGASWRQATSLLSLPASRKASLSALALGVARGMGQTMVSMLLLSTFNLNPQGSAGTLSSAILGAAEAGLRVGTPEYAGSFLFGIVLLFAAGGFNLLSRRGAGEGGE